MKEIILSLGKVALVDDEDYIRVNYYTWSAHETIRGGWYAVRGTPQVLMHRFIMRAPPSILVDHWDHDGLNNQKYNLRECSYSQNGGNRFSNAGYRHKGLLLTRNGRWGARIMHNGRRIWLGTFDTEIEAAEAYNGAALELFGEFAFLNNTGALQ